MSAAAPTLISRDPESRNLHVKWADDHETEFTYQYLRGYCPCAVCQGHEVSEVRYQPQEGQVNLLGIELVGNYGLTFRWSDGHATGIYRFDFLREICPCPLCKPDS